MKGKKECLTCEVRFYSVKESYNIELSINLVSKCSKCRAWLAQVILTSYRSRIEFLTSSSGKASDYDSCNQEIHGCLIF
jgi:hypothetical protein